MTSPNPSKEGNWISFVLHIAVIIHLAVTNNTNKLSFRNDTYLIPLLGGVRGGRIMKY